MKTLAITLLLALAGCDVDRRYEWVIERQGRSAQEIQADYDVMARHGWHCEDDDDLETSGHYVYFVKLMTASTAAIELHHITAELKTGRAR